MPGKRDNVKFCRKTKRYRAVLQVNGKREYGSWRTLRRDAVADVERMKREFNVDWTNPRTEFTLGDGFELVLASHDFSHAIETDAGMQFARKGRSVRPPTPR